LLVQRAGFRPTTVVLQLEDAPLHVQDIIGRGLVDIFGEHRGHGTWKQKWKRNGLGVFLAHQNMGHQKNTTTAQTRK
jgi:hypothetical protein